tara:strand:+ start:99 stop:575 length:477 start_codon:yes stop_codon:yes gene_type:complete
MIHIKEENYYIGTTRFNNSTFNENQMWREKHSHKGCIYGFGVTMSVKIPINSNVFVIEMNNNKNKIKGIGLIKNHFYNDQKYNIYNDQNYNRFIYKGSFRISREKIVELCGNFIDTLETILFKGKTHLKRGQGITSISQKKIDEYQEEFERLFRIILN